MITLRRLVPLVERALTAAQRDTVAVQTFAALVAMETYSQGKLGPSQHRALAEDAYNAADEFMSVRGKLSTLDMSGLLATASNAAEELR